MSNMADLEAQLAAKEEDEEGAEVGACCMGLIHASTFVLNFISQSVVAVQLECRS